MLEAEGLASGASGAAGMLAPLSEAAEDGPLLALGLARVASIRARCATRLIDETGIDPELRRSGLLVLVAMDDSEVQRPRKRASALWSSPALVGLDAQRPEPALEWISAQDLR